MAKHSKKFSLVKKYYDEKKWGKTAVRNAVEKNWITSEEFFEIVGEAYE